MWQAQETIYTTGSYDNPGFLWEVVAVDRAGEPLAVIAEAMGEKNARLVAAAPAMLAMLQRLTHPAAEDSERDAALELINSIVRRP